MLPGANRSSKPASSVRRDASASLRRWDRDTVDDYRRLRDWIGYAEEHGIILDFGDRLAGFGPDRRLVLVLDGWVEYPYSQTNYAASTAGVALKPPVLERLRDDGSWQVPVVLDLGTHLVSAVQSIGDATSVPVEVSDDECQALVKITLKSPKEIRPP